ncbi:MAG: TRAP transporter substrate-binding protein [Gammaproteobacteria bacterium]|nr:TRAP transporter substrate-binding protein [Gammaproteobacteria bacterium]MDA8014249.1 TRAP transporter substrate-binding protein [Gammaproteobacteria bacterium]
MKRRDLLIGAVGGVVVGGAATGVVTSQRGGQGARGPGIIKDRIEVAMVSTWPRDFPGLGTGAQRFAERVGEMSDGRIVVEYFAGGERVKPFDSFDEVASGNAQMYHAADYYWKGKHPSWAYFTAVPFGLTYTEMNAWIRFGGGQELWDELAAESNLKGLMCGNTGVQMGGWFRKEMNSADDFKGLKMRIPGLGGDVLTKLGASPVSLPGSQIYENLVSGAIDATEWVGPWNDNAMKFYEAAKYYYYPGMHEPGAMLSCGVNKDFWESLSQADRVMIEAAASMENDVMMSEYNAKNSEALRRLISEQGVQLRRFNDDIYDAFGRAAAEVFASVVDHSALARRVHNSFVRAREDVGAWAKISDQEYVRQRNRVLGL